VTRDVGGLGTADRWRLFIALPVPAAAATAIHDGLAAHRAAYPDARWIDPARYHVTLRFLGSIDTRLIEGLTVAVDACGATSEPFEVSMGRGGGTRGRSDVAWLELADGRDRVVALANRLDALLPPEISAGLRPFRPAPHLTIARRASAGLIEAIREGGARSDPAAWVADRLVLYRSYTGTPAGSSYRALIEARLAA
jgi:2'-5' RNA ligase